MDPKNEYHVDIHQLKNGNLKADVKLGDTIVKEIWQSPFLSPKVTLYLLKKQIEFFCITVD